jgi:signal peptidase I
MRHLAALVLAFGCAAPAAAPPPLASAPEVPAVRPTAEPVAASAFAGTAPAGTRLLARIATEAILEHLPRELAEPVGVIARGCNLDLAGLTAVEIAVAEPASVRIDVHGAVSEASVRCILEHTESSLGVVTIPGGIRVATPDALADGPGAPAPLREAFAGLGPARAVVAADLAGALLQARIGPEVELSLVLPPGQAEHAASWLKGGLAARPGLAAANVAIEIAGDRLVTKVGDLDLATLLGVARDVRDHVVESFKIPSRSMLPTLAVGDRVLVDKTAAPARRGEVIAFRHRDGGYVKRIVGLPGDRVEVVSGRPIVDGVLVPRCHVGAHDFDAALRGEVYVERLDGRSYLTMHDAARPDRTCRRDADCAAGDSCRDRLCGTLEAAVEVPAGHVYVLGDARDHSHDSRHWPTPVPLTHIDGRPFLVWLSLGEAGVAWHRSLARLDAAPVLPFVAEPLEARLADCVRELSSAP